MSNVQRFRLPNGLTVLAEPMRHAPVVALQIWIKVGSADETDEIAGIAHLHEHMLFKGTARRGVGEIAKTVESAGGEINAWTSFDETVYHVVMASNELETGVDILSDAVRFASFDAVELAREIEVVVEEIRRDRDQPSRRASRALFELLYQHHPYRHPVLGTEETVRSFTRERITAFFRSYYRPDNAVLVATGDFDMDALTSLVHTYFGTWGGASDEHSAKFSQPAFSDPRPVRAQEPVSQEIRVRVMREAVKETRLSAAWQIPGLCHQDIAALDVMSLILGHGDASRLYLETHRRRELVNDVYAYAYTPRDPGLFAVGASLKADNVQDALASILGEVYRCRDSLVSHEELERARIVLLSEASYAKETVQGQARKRAFYEVIAGDYNFEDTYYAHVAALTPADIRRVAQHYLTDFPAIVVQGPEDSLSVTAHQITDIVHAKTRAPKQRSHTAQRPDALGYVRVALDNGTVLLVRGEEQCPVVSMRAVGLGGLRYETSANQGIGTLFSSVWGQATESLTAEALARRISHLGGGMGAFSGRNALGLHGEFICDKAQEGLELFADVLLHARMSQQDLDRERAVLIEHIRNREDNAGGVAFDAFAAALYPHHPYGLRLSGTEESIARVTLSNLEQYAQQYLSADKLVIAVTGGVDVAHTIDYLSEQFHTNRSMPLPAGPQCDPPPASHQRIQRVLDKEQVHVIVGSMGARIAEEDKYRLDVLTTVLSGQSGRLFLDLRDIQSLAYSVSSSSVDGIDPGYVMVHMATAPEKVKQALAGMYGHLDRMRDELVSPTELERAQRYLVGSHAIGLQRTGSRAMMVAISERLGLPYDIYTRYPAAIRQVTAEAIRDAARRYLAPERLIEVIVGRI